jgi:predicted transglutaminase-like cysteine proteinase
MSTPVIAKPKAEMPSLPSSATALEVGTDPVSVPAGWIEFCDRYKGECSKGKAGTPDIIDEKHIGILDKINVNVNKWVKPISDMAHWKRIDRWDYPMDGKGDCEDYALMKRKMAIDAGVPSKALLMAVVINKQNPEGHAILLAKTMKGYLALDNRADKLLNADALSQQYAVVKIQSQQDPNIWVSLSYKSSNPMEALVNTLDKQDMPALVAANNKTVKPHANTANSTPRPHVP